MVSIDEWRESGKLPSGWTWTPIEDVVTKISNGTTEKQGKLGAPVTRIETISNGNIDMDKVGYLENLPEESIEKYKLLNGDILFSHINSDSHLGKTAIFHLEPLVLLHGMNLLLIRPNKRCASSRYFNYICNYYRYAGTFISIAQHAVNQSSINQKKIKNLPIPLPPLNEQKRIVAKIEELFTKLDAGVESLKKVKAQIKRYRQAVLKAAFEGKLTEGWREANKKVLEAVSTTIEEIIEERKENNCKEVSLNKESPYELPKKWAWAGLAEIAEFKNGINFSKEQKTNKGILTIDVLNMYSKGIYVDLAELYRVEKRIGSEYHLTSKDLLFVRSSVKRDGVGWVSAFKEIDEPVTFCGFIIRARLLHQRISSKYVAYYFRTTDARKKVIGISSQVTITNINQSSIGSVMVPLAPFKEQHQIVSEIERRFSVADEAEKIVDQSLKQAERLRQSILKRAFEGKLVPQDPNDEPASVLLERIKAEKARLEAEGKVKKKKVWKGARKSGIDISAPK